MRAKTSSHRSKHALVRRQSRVASDGVLTRSHFLAGGITEKARFRVAQPSRATRLALVKNTQLTLQRGDRLFRQLDNGDARSPGRATGPVNRQRDTSVVSSTYNRAFPESAYHFPANFRPPKAKILFPSHYA